MNTTDTIIFDRAAALDRMEGDEQGLLEIANLFIEEVPNELNAIRQAMIAGDASTVTCRAHSLKDASANLGALHIQATSAAMESLSRKGGLEGARTLIDEIEKAYHEFRMAFVA